jgi:uncharacterized OsmC-like protein
MKSNQEIKRAINRTEGVFAARPSAAQITKTGRATMIEGLLCQYTEGDFTIRADTPEIFGGEGKALSPGGYLRGGLSMCLAINYAMRAAQNGVTLRKVEVDIESDADLRGVYGAPGVRCSPSEVRDPVRVESDAPEEAVLAVIEAGDAKSPVLDTIKIAQRLVRSVEIKRPETV